jgi:hypothetical protein
MSLQHATHAPSAQPIEAGLALTRRAGTVLCIAVASDCGASLRAAVDRTADALSSFDQVRWLVVECGSSDDTVAQLRALQIERPGFEFESLGQRALASTPGPHRSSLGRARCLERLASDPRYRDVAHLVDVDLGHTRSEIGTIRG